jgi:type 1 glutamine amidotransferase
MSKYLLKIISIAFAVLSFTFSCTQNEPINALIITGHDEESHKWSLTSGILEKFLVGSGDFTVEVIKNPDMVRYENPEIYDVVIMKYNNYALKGEVISQESREWMENYIRNGGGLCLIHFACGAFHYSLPGTDKESDWPEFREICPRVWHWGISEHDLLREFEVKITSKEHPITKDIESFLIVDELYYDLEGAAPINVLAEANSWEKKQDFPMAWTSTYGKGLVFQTVLGHDEWAFDNEGFQKLIIRGCKWAAGRLH